MSEVQAPEITQEIYEQAVVETDDSLTFLRFYHFLAHLNYLKPVEQTKYGAIIAPYKMMRSIAYGFTFDKSVFVIHSTGIVFEYFERFLPVGCMLTKEGDKQDGITLMMKPLSYAEYKFPPVLLFLPIISPVVFKRLKDNCKMVCFSKIEQSIINPNYFDIKKVVEGCVGISNESDLGIEDDEAEMLRIF